MASLDMARYEAYRDRRRKEERLSMLLLCVNFPLFLMAALVMRLVGLTGGGRTAGPRRSIFAEARSAAASAIPFVFR